MGLNQVKAQYTLSGIPAYVSIPSVALMDIEPGSGNINLTITQPSEAGASVTTPSSDNSKWINYTSGNISSITRKVMVQITSGTVPAGTALDLTTSTYSGSGAGGTFGTPNSTIQLSNSAQVIITGISSCYTGDGASNGHCLTFSWRITNYTNLKTTAANTIVINYTFMDN